MSPDANDLNFKIKKIEEKKQYFRARAQKGVFE
jgi:hypothetical protein